MTAFTNAPPSNDDADLARAAASGDRTALGAIYDRYADRLHDFCVGMLRDREAAADCVQDVFVTAATKLGQLREADRLRPWLYAIARSECLARIRDRKREQPTEELPEMQSLDDSPETLVARAGLVELIRDVSCGLNDRDRVVLELSYRQGLTGPELADALGVTAKNANNLVERLRDTVGRSLGALLICRQAKRNPAACPELAAVLADWDGEFTVLTRKRVARHIDDCDACAGDRGQMVNPAALLAATPVMAPAPVWLRERTLDQAVQALPPITPVIGQSWWPPGDFDFSDVAELSTETSQPRGRRGRASLGAVLLLLAAGGAILLAAPPRDAPANMPAREVSDSLVLTTPPPTTGVASRTAPSTPLQPPPAVTSRTVDPTSTPNAVPRTQTEPTTARPQPAESLPEPSTTVTKPSATRTTPPEPTRVVTEPSDTEPTTTVPKVKPSISQVAPPDKSVSGGGTGGGPVFG
jgi:RNA polymerase sigma factor (sigma-70 family)